MQEKGQSAFSQQDLLTITVGFTKINVTFITKGQQNLLRDPFVAIAPRFAPLGMPRLRKFRGEPASQLRDDTLGVYAYLFFS